MPDRESRSYPSTRLPCVLRRMANDPNLLLGGKRWDARWASRTPHRASHAISTDAPMPISDQLDQTSHGLPISCDPSRSH